MNVINTPIAPNANSNQIKIEEKPTLNTTQISKAAGIIINKLFKDSHTITQEEREGNERERGELLLDALGSFLNELILYTQSWIPSYIPSEDITERLQSQKNIAPIGEDFSIRHQNYTVINHTIKPLYADYYREIKLASNTNIPLGFVEYIIENYEVQDGVIKEKTNKVNSLRN